MLGRLAYVFTFHRTRLPVPPSRTALIALSVLVALGAGARAQAPDTQVPDTMTADTQAARDDRIAIVLNEAERGRMLQGMRTYLESVHEIVAALAANTTATVPAAAKRSGAAMLQDVSPLTALKLPPEFMSMSFDTHDKFDRLAAEASKAASRSELLRDLDQILANCTACHQSFKLVAPP